MELVLVRHGAVTEEANGRCYGRLDVELSAEGRRQSGRLAARLAREPVAAVLSSPLLRARDTADPIAAAHGLPVSVHEELRELDFGELEGLSFEQIEALRPVLYQQWMQSPTTVRFPGGECYADLHERVATAVSRFRSSFGGHVVIAVTHGGVVRAVLAEALGIPYDRVFQFAVDAGSVTRVAWVEESPLVLAVNVPV